MTPGALACVYIYVCVSVYMCTCASAARSEPPRPAQPPPGILTSSPWPCPGAQCPLWASSFGPQPSVCSIEQVGAALLGGSLGLLGPSELRSPWPRPGDRQSQARPPFVLRLRSRSGPPHTPGEANHVSATGSRTYPQTGFPANPEALQPSSSPLGGTLSYTRSPVCLEALSPADLSFKKRVTRTAPPSGPYFTPMPR